MWSKTAKARKQRKHAKRRAVERYHLHLSKDKYEELIKRIKNNIDCVHLEKQSNRISLFALKTDDQWLPVIYDKNRHTVVTILPPEALDPYRHKLI